MKMAHLISAPRIAWVVASRCFVATIASLSHQKCAASMHAKPNSGCVHVASWGRINYDSPICAGRRRVDRVLANMTINRHPHDMSIDRMTVLRACTRKHKPLGVSQCIEKNTSEQWSGERGVQLEYIDNKKPVAAHGLSDSVIFRALDYAQGGVPSRASRRGARLYAFACSAGF